MNVYELGYIVKNGKVNPEFLKDLKESFAEGMLFSIPLSFASLFLSPAMKKKKKEEKLKYLLLFPLLGGFAFTGGPVANYLLSDRKIFL